MVFLLLISVLFEDPLPSLSWWEVPVGGDELKWRQLLHNHLMSPQGPHFSPHSTAKTMMKAQIYSEKTRLKKLMMIMIMKETTAFHGRQKLTSTM